MRRGDARLDLDFIDKASDRSSAATDVCQIDFDWFAAELKSNGFDRTTIYGEHGNVIYDTFSRVGMSIRVVTINEVADPTGKPPRSCVTAVSIP